MSTTRREIIKFGVVAGAAALLELRLMPAALARGTGSGDLTYLALKLLPGNKLALKLELAEIGQGVSTLLASLVAQELRLSPGDIHIEQPSADNNRDWPGYRVKGVGGSHSTRRSWQPVSRMAAVFGDLFLRAGAKHFQVERGEVELRPGLRVASGASEATFEQLATAAKTLVPDSTVKPRIITGGPTDIAAHFKRVDSRPKISGVPVYGIDVQLPGMYSAVIQRFPIGAGGPSIRNRQQVAAMTGVKTLLQTPGGIAVIADSYWQAERARRALRLDFATPATRIDIDTLYRGAMAEKGRMIIDRGKEVAGAPAFEAVYRQPFAAQCPIEPMNCTAWIHDDGCEVWTGTQNPLQARDVAARTAGLSPTRVTVHCLESGGGFGRRLSGDAVIEAVFLARKTGLPIKLYWSREDDLRGGYYRPAVWVACQVKTDDDGGIRSLHQQLIGPGGLWSNYPAAYAPGADSLEQRLKSLVKSWLPVEDIQRDPGPVAQGLPGPYRFSRHRVDFHAPALALPVGYWRAVGHNHNVFAIESLLDELANRRQQDPLGYRLALMADPRMAALLKHLKSRGVWANGRHQGLAVFGAYGSYIALVLNLVANGDAPTSVESACCAVDCGRVFNPDIVRQQVEGGILFGLSAALHEQIRFSARGVESSNFDTYPLLRMPEAPQISVELIDSTEAPGGVGELAVPVVAPALCNAIDRMTGRRIRQLPIVG